MSGKGRRNLDRVVLDDAYDFMDGYLVANDAQKVAMVLYAAATHVMREHATFGRMLFTSEREESGKTMAMMVTASLSSNPLDAEGTQYALQSALAAVANEPEKPVPTLYLDEVSDVFGKSGLNSAKGKIATIARKGYKRGATDAWSVNRVNEKFSIFLPFLMAGLGTAVPRDIRSRSIVIRMEPGKPRRYFDVREAEPYAEQLQAALASQVRNHAREIGQFRALGLHPRMVNRKLEVWEPLAAVAYTVGGQRWLNRCLAAFSELALGQSEAVILTPAQQVLKDVAFIAAQHRALTGEAFVGGLVLADELGRMSSPLYEGRTAASLACLIRDSVPLDSEQRTTPSGRVRGYPVQSLLEAWDSVRPVVPDDAELAEEVNPFAVPDDDAEQPVNTRATRATRAGSRVASVGDSNSPASVARRDYPNGGGVPDLHARRQGDLRRPDGSRPGRTPVGSSKEVRQRDSSDRGGDAAA